MNIVILERDSLGIDVNMSGFDSLGTVTTYATTTGEELADRIREAEILVVNKLPMNEETLGDAKNVKLIALTATGTNNVDFAYTESRGIAVANVPSYSTDSVAQHTFALLFYLLEKMAFFDQHVKSGDYSRSGKFSCLEMIYPELSGKTWGIIGLGAIGRKVAEIATVFGCRVIYYSASGRSYDVPWEQVDLDTLLKESDVVSVHAPLNQYTENLMDYTAFSKMKRTAVFINVGRGPIVVEEDLARALEEKLIGAAGLDVVRVEPITEDNPLMKFKDSTRLIITPHVAWATSEARQRCTDEVVRNIAAFEAGEPRNIVKG